MTPPFVVHDGQCWFKFSAEFEYDGKKYVFDFHARCQSEADEMLRAIRTTAVECHQIMGEIPARQPMSGLRVRWSCWWRNMLGI